MATIIIGNRYPYITIFRKHFKTCTVNRFTIFVISNSSPASGNNYYKFCQYPNRSHVFSRLQIINHRFPTFEMNRNHPQAIHSNSLIFKFISPISCKVPPKRIKTPCSLCSTLLVIFCRNTINPLSSSIHIIIFFSVMLMLYKIYIRFRQTFLMKAYVKLGTKNIYT